VAGQPSAAAQNVPDLLWSQRPPRHGVGRSYRRVYPLAKLTIAEQNGRTERRSREFRGGSAESRSRASIGSERADRGWLRPAPRAWIAGTA